MALPVGSVINYWSYSLEDDEGLVCDGSAYSRAAYPELFAVIGGAFGDGDKVTTFLVPDLRGRFVRATDSSPARGPAGVDPEADARVEMNLGGNAGNLVGSIQPDSLPTHNHGLENTFGVGGGPRTCKANFSDSNPYVMGTLPAGGAETRPVNAALVFVMLATQPTQRCPLGSIVGFGGNADPSDTSGDGDVWLICDGREFNRSAYQDFFNAFEAILGSGDGATTFTVPDLRGYFLRGVSPDGSRPAGQVQLDEFVSHTHGLAGSTSTEHIGGSDEQDMGAPGDGDFAGPTDNYVGGVETRPINAYLHYIIRTR